MLFEPPQLPTGKQLSKDMSEEDLLSSADNYFKDGEKATDAAYSPLRAQIFLQELTRRAQNRQTKAMLILTVVITIMTAIQLWLAVRHGDGSH